MNFAYSAMSDGVLVNLVGEWFAELVQRILHLGWILLQFYHFAFRCELVGLIRQLAHI